METSSLTPIKHEECGALAYSLRTDSIRLGGVLRASDCVYPNGTSPNPADRVSCGSCGLPASFPIESAQTIRRQGYGTAR